MYEVCDFRMKRDTYKINSAQNCVQASTSYFLKDHFDKFDKLDKLSKNVTFFTKSSFLCFS